MTDKKQKSDRDRFRESVNDNKTPAHIEHSEPTSPGKRQEVVDTHEPPPPPPENEKK